MIVPEGMKVVLPGKGNIYRPGDEVPKADYETHVKPHQKKIDDWVSKRKKFKEKTLNKIMDQGLTKKKVSEPVKTETEDKK